MSQLLTTATKALSSDEGSAQAYIDDLDKRCRAAANDWAQTDAAAKKAQKNYDKALTWDNSLKAYWESIDKTDRLAETLDATLKDAQAQAQAIGDMTACATAAFQNMVQDLKIVAECVESLKIYVDTLKECLVGVAPPTDAVMAGLSKVSEALGKALQCLLDTLIEMLKVLKNAQNLTDQMDASGLTNTLREMEMAFVSPKEKSYYDYSGSWAPCIMPENPAFPLKDNKDAYYTALNADKAAVEDCLYTADNNLRDQAVKGAAASNTAKGCLDSLKAAKAAAAAAFACKIK